MHWVGGQLKDVAKGTIVKPENRTWHNGTMSPDMMRVTYSMVLPGCEQVEPPSQPSGWDDEETAAVLNTGFGYMFLWPKSQIRLGTEDHQLNITPEAAQPAHEEDFMMADLDDNMAQNPDDDDFEIDPNFGDQFVNTRFSAEGGYSDLYEPATSGAHRFAETQPAKPPCQVRLFPTSQETPPPAHFTEPPRPAVPLISPSTLHKAVGEVNAVADAGKDKKKGRKRKPKVQAAPNPVLRAQDGPAGQVRNQQHVAGTPMMCPSMLEVAGSHMRSLHHACLYIEECRLKENDQSYLVFKAKVPKMPCFVCVPPGDIFYVRHTDIFDMLNGFRLHDTLVRLFSLNMSMQITRDNIPLMQIVDPYFMRDAVLKDEEDIHMATDYLTTFLQTYSDKRVILIPYHPITEGDRTGCVLISLNLRRSSAVYLDSNSAIRKDYTKIKTVLDGALTAYVAQGGIPPETPVMRFGTHVFRHTMQFACVKQPTTSGKDAFYAIHHMKSYFNDMESLTLPSDVVRWGEKLASTQDRTLRQSFFEIQEEIAKIVHTGVMRSGGTFCGGNPPPNRDIDERLSQQADGRMFMMMAKNRSGFIHAPAKPTTSQQPNKS